MVQAKNIVILGGGTAGWMAANLLIKKWSDLGGTVSLIESPEIGIVGVGEGSTPTLKRFFEIIDVAESDWMSECNATYKVDIKFANWSPESGISQYSHPFVSQVDTFTRRAFEVNCRTRRLGLDVNTRPSDFFINGVLASQNKAPVTPENFPFRMEYGYHFDSHLLGQFLKRLAISRGVKHVSDKITSVEQKTNGDIARLTGENGQKYEGDFFIDCSGFAAVLMQKTLNVPFQSFKDNLFNDSAVVMPTSHDAQSLHNIPVYTQADALSNGWCWNIPLTNRFGNGYVYSSDFISDEQAEIEFRKHLNMLESEVECRHLKMRVGQLNKHWQNNCLAVGLSQGFIEPLEATALHLVQIAIELFILKYQEGHFSNALQAEYNSKMHERYERVRDYIVAHYKLNTRCDSEYWRANRENMQLSNSLRHILDVWYRQEDLTKEINRQGIENHFSSMSWHCLLAGYGVFPALAENQPGQGDLYKEQNIESFLHGCALNFASHQTHLTQG
ncbi:tryptophan halogenase family protein [Catenovulum sediminis]|uniref:Tryptophan halogenase family protein n=1 Tax=Catenovulum sediminis TaxID=1740262 RepID=A0ABV1RK29_9ALTE